ncbi:MAG TPA: Pr6Pr family membrane protein [Terriglobales bacterium]|nr:Pr6Pr family membrane protein [Terriglobales bacterium]
MICVRCSSGLALEGCARWLVFPAAYCGYSLVRGALVGWYLYPFLDPRLSGASQVSVNVVALIAAFLVVGSLLMAIGGWRRRRAN